MVLSNKNGQGQDNQQPPRYPQHTHMVAKPPEQVPKEKPLQQHKPRIVLAMTNAEEEAPNLQEVPQEEVTLKPSPKKYKTTEICLP